MSKLHTIMADTASKISVEFNRLKSKRQNWETHWQSVADFVAPTRQFTSFTERGTEKRRLVFDSTAEESAEVLASGIHGLLINPAIKWPNLRVADPGLNEIPVVKSWLDDSTNRMLALFSNPRFGFDTQAHEAFLDLVTFGTSALILTERNGEIRFQAWPLSEVFCRTDEHGMIDTVYRKFPMTAIQAWDRWGNKAGKEILAIIKNDLKRYHEERQYIQAIFPRKDRDAGKIDRLNKPWASVVIDQKSETVINEGGFDEFPFLIPRWAKAPGEVYGRSPAMKMLPTIRLLNAMVKTILVASEKAVDPPMIVHGNSIEGPIMTSPGSIIPARPGVGRTPIEPLPQNGRFEVGLQLVQDAKESIKSGFFLDLIGALPLSDRMTTVEIRARMAQKMQMLSPVLARLQQEFLTPLIRRTLDMMSRTGKLAEAPEEFAGMSFSELEIDYVSPLALSQRASDLDNITRLQAFIMPNAELDPTIMDNWNPDELFRYAALVTNTPQRVIRNPREVQMIRQSREEMMRQQQQLEAAKSIAETAETGAKAVNEAQGGNGRMRR